MPRNLNLIQRKSIAGRRRVLARTGPPATSDLSPLSGVEWKLDFGDVRAVDDTQRRHSDLGQSAFTRAHRRLSEDPRLVEAVVIKRSSSRKRSTPHVALFLHVNW
jgi:hypothetical protein